jgi:hypothetical protein
MEPGRLCGTLGARSGQARPQSKDFSPGSTRQPVYVCWRLGFFCWVTYVENLDLENLDLRLGLLPCARCRGGGGEEEEVGAVCVPRLRARAFFCVA